MRTSIFLFVICAAATTIASGQYPPASSVAANSPAAGAAASSANVTVDHCEVRLDEEAKVPAQEAGVLTKINVREGDQVPLNALLAQIDDIQAQKQRKNALAEFNGASEKSNSDIDIRYAAATSDVAKYEYLRDQEANKKAAGSVSDVEMKEKEFAWHKADLAIEQARKQHTVDGFTAEAKQAEVEMADESIKRRQIAAPIDGVVQRIYSHLGEWVKPGDIVVRVIRMDRLRVEGRLDIAKYSPGDVADRSVVVQVELAGGRKVQFPGRIVFVDPEVQGELEYEVRAEVDNRKEDGQWLLRPGMPATMTFQLK
ncbi:MAG TPA: HlyD family efflux transporter periplasmic adaptor subunit [Pirellulales bacterium]|nr:HlyD family efflux transporter periplasmic adaptor subunit [Pirellulales bacterium]